MRVREETVVASSGHMASKANTSDYGGSTEFIPVPEPSVLMILTPGLLTLAAVVTRRLSSQPD